MKGIDFDGQLLAPASGDFPLLYASDSMHVSLPQTRGKELNHGHLFTMWLRITEVTVVLLYINKLVFKEQWLIFPQEDWQGFTDQDNNLDSEICLFSHTVCHLVLTPSCVVLLHTWS